MSASGRAHATVNRRHRLQTDTRHQLWPRRKAPAGRRAPTAGNATATGRARQRAREIGRAHPYRFNRCTRCEPLRGVATGRQVAPRATRRTIGQGTFWIFLRQIERGKHAERLHLAALATPSQRARTCVFAYFWNMRATVDITVSHRAELVLESPQAKKKRRYSFTGMGGTFS